MTTYKIFDSFGKSITYRGTRVASVRSRPIEISRGCVWFELDGYQTEMDRWIVTVCAHRETDHDQHEVISFFCTLLAESAQDFLIDFDPAVILPSTVLEDYELPRNHSLVVVTDHVYLAAALQLGKQLKDIERQRPPRPIRSSEPKITDWNPIGPTKISVVNRLKDWFGI